MTPKEKADYLVNKYYYTMNPDAPDCNISSKQCIQCTIISVKEIIAQIQKEYNEMDHGQSVRSYLYEQETYWNNVLQELFKSK